MAANAPRRVLLVGSVALPTAKTVFDEVGCCLGSLMPAIPDGETGERLKWVGFFSDKLSQAKGLVVANEIPFGGEVPQTLKFYKAAEGVDLASIDLASPGYAEAAISSYADFVKTREAGKIPHGVRFQVSLPSPLVLAAFFYEPFEKRLPLVEKFLLQDVQKILATIPHEDLAIQWDLAFETESEEARRHPENAPPFIQPDFAFESMIEASARLFDAIPSDVLAGVHLCYGNPDGKHIVEPVDGSVMRDIMNALTKAVKRQLNWIHLPVPIDRNDDAFFVPFETLDIPKNIELYLGVVHELDGVEGAAKRLAVAEKFIGRKVGIATECGLGRRKPENIPSLLELHRQIATEV